MLISGIVLLLSFAVAKNKQICPAGEHWVKAHERNSYTTGTGNFVEATFVKAHCQSNPKGYEVWKNQISNGLPKDWPHKSETAALWSEAEKEKFFEALSKIPEILQNRSVKIYRGKASKDGRNPATSAESINAIVLYNSAFTSDVSLAQILSHEFAHIQYARFSNKEREDYRYAANWFLVDRRKSLYVSRATGYVQDDGRDSPEEDYCNNVEYYLFHPEMLKKQTPQAYKWLENKFGDKLRIGSE